MYAPGTMHSMHGRHYVLNCLRGIDSLLTLAESETTPVLYSVWAWGVLEAFDKAEAAGYWPLSVHSSSWSETSTAT